MKDSRIDCELKSFRNNNDELLICIDSLTESNLKCSIEQRKKKLNIFAVTDTWLNNKDKSGLYTARL